MRNSTPNTWCRWVVSGVRCFWGCWLVRRYRGMNALRTSVPLVKLLTLSRLTQSIHSLSLIKFFKKAACSLGIVLGMMIRAIKISVCDDWGLFKDELEIRYLIHEIIPHRRRQGVIWIKIIVVNVLDIGCWQAHAGDNNSAFTNQFLLQTMLPLLSSSTRDGCKDRPNNWYHDSLLVSGDRPSLLR